LLLKESEVSSRSGGYQKEFVAELYDPVYDNLNRRDIQFFVGYSKEAKGRTLELGCGTGRVLIPTAAAGYDVTGLEISPHMLKKCRDKLAKQPNEVRQRVKLIEGNMTTFQTGEIYSLITTPFRSFQHLLTVEEQMSCLTYANRHLDPHGLFILDLIHTYPPATFDPKYRTELELDSGLQLADGRTLRRMIRIADFHPDKQYNDTEMIFYVSYPDGRQERLVQAFPLRYFFRYEVEHLLSLCGFKVMELFGDYNGSKFSSDSPEMIFVAEKR
jgi:SAM-dependent methyltransferase